VRGNVITGAKGNDSSTGHIWVVRFHHVTAFFSLGVRSESYGTFISLIINYFSGRGIPRIIETTDTESANTEARQ
jgi:hypothetical protein